MESAALFERREGLGKAPPHFERCAGLGKGKRLRFHVWKAPQLERCAGLGKRKGCASERCAGLGEGKGCAPPQSHVGAGVYSLH